MGIWHPTSKEQIPTCYCPLLILPPSLRSEIKWDREQWMELQKQGWTGAPGGSRGPGLTAGCGSGIWGNKEAGEEEGRYSGAEWDSRVEWNYLLFIHQLEVLLNKFFLCYCCSVLCLFSLMEWLWNHFVLRLLRTQIISIFIISTSPNGTSPHGLSSVSPREPHRAH